MSELQGSSRIMETDSGISYRMLLDQESKENMS